LICKVLCSSYWLIAEIGVPLPISLNCSRRFIPSMDAFAANLCPLSADWLHTQLFAVDKFFKYLNF
jgi:hypothetical protein